MSVIVAGFSSAILSLWAANEKMKSKKAYEKVEELRSIPVVSIAGLSHLLPHQDAKKLVIFRRIVMPISSASKSYTNISDLNVRNLKNLSSTKVGDDQTQPPQDSKLDDLTTLRSTKTGQEVLVVEEKTTVPFIIADHGVKIGQFNYVLANLEGGDHPLPLRRVSSEQREGSPVQVDVLTEEEILPVNTCVTAVGLFTGENGILSIKPYEDLDYFITTKTRKEMIEEQSAKAKLVSRRGDFLSKVSVGLAGYAITAIAIRFIRNLCE